MTFLKHSPTGCNCEDFACRAARAASQVAPEVAQPVAWVPVSERLPDSGMTVLACYRNRAGQLRRIRAEWIAAKTQESGDNDIGEYDEATDTHYDPEGWYERIDNWDDYSAVAVNQGEVTHWMRLPAPPAPPQAVPQPVAWVPPASDVARWALEAIEAGPRADLLMNLDAIKAHLRRLRDTPSAAPQAVPEVASTEAEIDNLGMHAGAVAQPPGYVLVPVEPTREMLQAVTAAVPSGPYDFAVMATWRAMLAAAPQAVPQCIGADPLCPCRDGAACHYRDAGSTLAMPVTKEPTERESNMRLLILKMARRMSKQGDKATADAAVDYLNRVGLGPNPLRGIAAMAKEPKT